MLSRRYLLSLLLVLSLLSPACGEDDTEAPQDTAQASQDSSDASDVEVVDPCPATGAALTVSPTSVTLDRVGGILSQALTIENTGTEPLCFGETPWTIAPEDARLTTELALTRLLPGESAMGTVALAENARGAHEATLTWHSTNLAESSITIDYDGGPLIVGDVNSPDDIDEREIFVHLVQPDGTDLLVHTDIGGYEASPKAAFVIEGENGFELRLTGIPPQEGTHAILEILLSGENFAIFSEGEVPATAQVEVTSVSGKDISGQLVTTAPLLVPIVQGNLGDTVELKAFYFNRMTCLDCERLCGNGLDDDNDGATDCDDDDCELTKGCSSPDLP